MTPLKPTCTPNGNWIKAPPPPSDLEWIERHSQTPSPLSRTPKDRTSK